LALHFRQRVHHSMALLHVLAVLTGLLLMTYAEFVAHPLLMGTILGLFATGAAVAWLGNRRSWHRRYLDYRVLAEGLRVQAYWAVASVPSSQRVGFAYDSFLQKQDVELGWIRHAMRGVALGGERRSSDAGLQSAMAAPSASSATSAAAPPTANACTAIPGCSAAPACCSAWRGRWCSSCSAPGSKR
jgi:hypothetical protein